MPEILTNQQLNSYRDRINSGGLEQVRQVYSELYAKGYNYAGWALGVAKGNTLTGLAALDFLQGTALLGLDSVTCRNLSQNEIDLIRIDMGRSYVNSLIAITRLGDGTLSRDVKFDEVSNFHKGVFTKYNLTLTNWTLNTPMELIRQTEGSAAVEAMWQRIRDTGGGGLDGTVASMMLLNKVGRLAFSEDSRIRDAALQWMDSVPGVANLKQMGKSLDLFGQWLVSDAGGDSVGAAVSVPPAWKVVLDAVDGQTKIIRNTSHVIDKDVAEGPDTYVVRQGDSLWKIAIENGWDFDALKAANSQLTDPNFIRLGQRINGLGYMQPGSAVQISNLLQLLNAEHQVQVARQAGQLGRTHYASFTEWAASQFADSVGLRFGGGVSLQLPANPWLDLDPIGAFYESNSAEFDSAESIAGKTPVLLDAARRRLRAAALQARDINGDNKLTGAELQGLSAWTDTNENGILDTGELQSTEQAGITMLRATNCDFYTQGNGLLASGPQAAPIKRSDTAGLPARVDRTSVVPSSNYRALRDSDNVYLPPGGGYIVWGSGQVKINYTNRSYLIGTDGNDNFDGNYYAAYRQYFSNDLLVNFLAGGGDDVMGGSVRNDRLWGGTGNDLLFGYAGDDQLFGEEDNDELQGMDGNDTLDGGVGNDLLFGQVGNDALFGGDGNDTLVGFTAGNESKQTLATGETDNDALYGGNGADQLMGGLGDDYLDGGNDADILFGDTGNDTVLGGAGNDEIQGDAGADKLHGEDGNDKVFGSVGDDQIWGGAGDDVLVGFTPGNDAKQTLLAGETDNDSLYGGLGQDQLYGGLGNDYLDGGAGYDVLAGGDGNDMLHGGAGDDEFDGGSGDDLLVGDAGADKLCGGVGNDALWGGDGDDIMTGFTPANDTKQTLVPGETDDDLLYGGAGNDLLLGAFGNDVLYGEDGNDELQGAEGDDVLYGGAGDDRLFAQVGNDVLYGGEGDDLLVGFAAANDAKQSLKPGETDDDCLYGGAGSDVLLGGAGNDYLDGGAGADEMEGGQGDDTYIVNSANDVILEHGNEGHDTVYSSVNYILNANVEDLHLLEGFNIHGTGNGRDNVVIGNSRDNIIDGVTGADTMFGGAGDDTYYVDNAGDTTVEYADEGVDMVQSRISIALGDNVENLNLLDFGKPEKGLVNGRPVLISGYPKANELDYMQGDAIPDFKGTCALTSIANLLVEASTPTTEGEVVQRAINNQWAVTDPAATDYQRGGSNFQQQQALLDSYGMRNALLSGYSEQSVANLVRSGRGVLIGLNAGKLWNDAHYFDDGGVNHVVTVTGAAYAEDDGALMGFYIADSGRQRVSDMTRFVSLEAFRSAAAVPNAYSIYTIEAVKSWDEDVNGSGNALDNILVGNRGNNILYGGAGNDTLVGGAGCDVLIGGDGGDTYVFNRGDGPDLIREFAAQSDHPDLVLFGKEIDHNDLWFRRVAEDLEISVLGTSDSLLVEGWYTDPSRRIARFQAGDGLQLLGGEVEAMVSAMDAYTTSLVPGLATPGILPQSYQPALVQQVASSWR